MLAQIKAAAGGVSRRSALYAALIGAVAGLLSGMFGVGGGFLMVPALVALLGLSQRQAVATSLVAIMPAALVGCISYGLRGQFSLGAAGLLVVGSLMGTQIGVRLLHRLSDRVLRAIFLAFIVLVFIGQQVSTPVRNAEFVLTPMRCVILVGIGLLAGVLAGLVGVGGGVVVVPGLEIIMGAGDLLARGTSLAAMVPTAISGTIANVRKGSAQIRIGLLAGTLAALISPLGAMIATQVSPVTGRWLFNAVLLMVIVSVLRRGCARS